jgi:hypothetical protein
LLFGEFSKKKTLFLCLVSTVSDNYRKLSTRALGAKMKTLKNEAKGKD